MIVRIYGMQGRSRASTIALLAVAVILGALAIAFGLFLLLAITGVGLVVGVATLLYRKLTGRGTPLARSWDERARLDPALEVFPREGTSRELSTADEIQPSDPDQTR